MTTIDNATSFDFLSGSCRQPEPPLFLRIVAPPEQGGVLTCNLTFLQKPLGYAIHWIERGYGTADRHLCTGGDCPWCKERLVPSEMYSVLALRSDSPQLVVAQMSKAVGKHVVRAAVRYAGGCRGRYTGEPFQTFGLSGPIQPEFVIKARRTGAGPRYRVEARQRTWTCDPATGQPVGLGAWFGTPAGDAWLQDALANTAPLLHRYATCPEAFDVLRVVFPEEYADDESWADDLDD